MKLSEKAAKVNFDDLDDESGSGSSAAQPAGGAPAGSAAAPRTRATGVAGITDRINLHHQVTELQTQLAAFEAAQLVVMLDPAQVKESKWKNRHELSYSTQEYMDLRDEIAAAGGNVQPIKVRRKAKGANGEDEYEIVYGRRRNRSCLDLGFKVAAIIEDMDDLALFTAMERENRNRADLSPWEQGVMYKDALDAKLFASQKQMAAALGISAGALSMALALASLPDEVISAFPSPLELQYRWGTELTSALEADTARVITKAQELGKMSPRPTARVVLEALVGAGSGAPKVQPEARELRSADRMAGIYSKDAKGRISVKLSSGALTVAKEKKLVEFLERLLQ
ncbi:ParB/RepB/Spo0J family partition protein [Caenimonas sedimenti]|uniref:ParB/RepB/Spo0J family partition protein n=1 Tax=Caenimonas sedimenti TaxID=2596921 RepID=A0A562ZSK1_9BURK|nr:ParB/RepB/Spo0J family partition protein [Caenimonas sedimenti]TWO71503.1 ParB/RepB/Spo0J family partition protein [Caenimonas sedimenti]